MRHIVAMRFLSIKRDDAEPLAAESAEYYADVFARYTLKSLLNMSNKRFDVVFMVSDDRDLRALAPLVPYAADVDASFVRYGKFPEFVERYRGRDRLVVTRCDSDDLFGKRLVDDVQDFASEFEGPAVFGYQSSLMYREGTGVLRAYPINYRKGHWSAFQSLVYTGDSRLKGVTPYSWKHPDFFEFLTKRGFSNDELVKMHRNGGEEFPYVWIRHSKNISSDTERTDYKYTEFHGITRERFVDNFGTDVPVKW